MPDTDLIIVGGGLAGTLLALECEKRGRRVLIIDDALRDAATPVAAGLINPVTGMRLTVAPDAVTTIPFALSTFRDLEQKFGVKLFREIPIFRAYANADERAVKAKRAADPACARWFGPDIAPDAVHRALNAPHGGFFITGGGWVDLPELIQASREYFAVGSELARVRSEQFAETRASSLPTATIKPDSNEKNPGDAPGGFAARSESTPYPTNPNPANPHPTAFSPESAIGNPRSAISLRSEPFVHAGLEIFPDGTGVRYRGATARHIVFAEGAAVKKNPWFGHLAWQPAKGEFITADTGRNDGPDFALKIGTLAIPLGDGRWRAGSNYEWDFLDTTPTPAVRDTLLAGFEAMFRAPPGAVVTTHLAGIRPAARGAKPIVGPHPEFPALHVFNGFGAKGCTWIPGHARDYAARLD